MKMVFKKLAYVLASVIFAASLAFADDPLLSLEPGSTVEIGQTSYKILTPLGRGGFNVVYRAKNESTGREVALRFETRELLEGSEAKELNSLLEHPKLKQSKHLLHMERTPNQSIEVTTPSGNKINARTTVGTAEVIRSFDRVFEMQSSMDVINLNQMRYMSQGKFEAVVNFYEKMYFDGLRGIFDMAETGFTHRDIKFQNTGFTGSLADYMEGKAELVFFDFETSKRHGKMRSEYITGTPEAIAYEMTKEVQYVSPLADIYSWHTQILKLMSGRTYIDMAAEANPAKYTTTDGMERFWKTIDIAANPAEFERRIEGTIARFFDERIEDARRRFPEATSAINKLIRLKEIVLAGIKAGPDQRRASLTASPHIPKEYKTTLKNIAISIDPPAFMSQCEMNARKMNEQGAGYMGTTLVRPLAPGP